MSMKFRCIVAACATTILCAAASVQATTHPHDRNGFVIGFSLGGGSAGIKDGDSREGGGTGNFRIGYAVRPDLVLHFEGTGWTRTFAEPIGDVTWTFSTYGASATYYVPNSGAFIRGGIGAGVANVELASGGVKVSADETGLGLVVAGGYEWRLTQKFALGPQVEFTYQDLDLLGSSNVVGGGLGFNWYW